MDTTLQNYECLIYLMSCALNGTAAQEHILEGVDLEQLLHRARMHSVAAMVCMALEKTEAFAAAQKEIQKQWIDVKNKAIRKNMLLDAERGAILSRLEAEGIWHMPLKGSVLKDWYPKAGMREMADNDILFDAAKRERVRQIFLSRGYEVPKHSAEHHDGYHKPPIYNFEMHTALFSGTFEAAERYKDISHIKERLLPVDGTAYGFAFTPEDFYGFAIEHAYKHFSNYGTGIRTLADMYVMNRHLEGRVDRDKVAKNFDRPQIAEYERSSRALAQKLFSAPRLLSELKLTEAEEELLGDYCGSATYGTLENHVNRSLHTLQPTGGTVSLRTKLSYCRSRLFPGRDFCKIHYPFVYQHPYLFPFFWVWRIVVKGWTNRKKLKKEFAFVKKCK